MTTTSTPGPLRDAGGPEREAARAFAAELFDRHRRMVEGLCRGLLRDRGEAEDAAQQSFLSAYRALLSGTDPREPAAWLATIARHECLARIRARMREPLPANPAEGFQEGGDPVAEAIRRADIAALWQAVSELPAQQREALLLREFGGLSYGELAHALGVTAPAVESLLFRARAQVRGRLKIAYASLSGAGWAGALQDAVARLLSAGGAAKAATATVGVAVVAGGALMGERHLGEGTHPQRTVPRSPARVEAAPHAAAPAAAAVRSVRPAATAHRLRPAATAERGTRGPRAEARVERVDEDGAEDSARRGDGGRREGGEDERSTPAAPAVPRVPDAGEPEDGESPALAEPVDEDVESDDHGESGDSSLEGRSAAATAEEDDRGDSGPGGGDSGSSGPGQDG